jgi:hypothetical protein
MISNKEGQLWWMHVRVKLVGVPMKTNVATTTKSKSLYLSHHRLGHVSSETIKKMVVVKIVSRLSFVNMEKPFCSRCAQGKNHHWTFESIFSLNKCKNK